MKTRLKQLWRATRRCHALWRCAVGLVWVGLMTGSLLAAPFDRQISFTQPDGTVIQLHGRGDEFSAVFETLDGYTVVFDPGLRAYCYAQLAADGSLISSGAQVHLVSPTALGLTPHLRMSAEARRRQILQRWQRWEAAMQIRERWAAQKAAARRYYDRKGPQFAPPPFTTTGLKVGLTLLIDFSDDPATVPQAEIVNFLNGDNYTGYGNNGSVKSYFWDNSGGLLLYTNVVTIYVRVPNPKSTYNDITQDAGDNANRLIKDALDALKALPDYNTTILPTFNALTVDQNNQVVAFNVFYAGGNGGVWAMGLWPHSWALYNVGPQPLGNGMSVFRYQITNIGNELEIGTFCHENGHMLCGYPDIYDYDYASSGGAGMGRYLAASAFFLLASTFSCAATFLTWGTAFGSLSTLSSRASASS
ncbi:MAG: M6 family metalloprotease domain-containing protein, partial [Verrucomicrobiae bacterium]|nr:M6 family metalloprotease domain-containing protein [Verrucomicrobiae bacterium]